MQFPKQTVIVLGSAGLMVLGAYSYRQPAANAGSHPSTAIRIAQSLKPATQTSNVRMTLSIGATPLHPGKHKLMLTVMNANGQPIATKNVQVAMIMPAKAMAAMGMSGMGEGTAKTSIKPAAKPGTFEVESNLSYGGQWQLKVNVKDTQPPANAVFNIAVK